MGGRPTAEGGLFLFVASYFHLEFFALFFHRLNFYYRFVVIKNDSKNISAKMKCEIIIIIVSLSRGGGGGSRSKFSKMDVNCCVHPQLAATTPLEKRERKKRKGEKRRRKKKWKSTRNFCREKNSCRFGNAICSKFQKRDLAMIGVW